MRFEIIKAVSVATLLLVGALIMPRAAEAQARGTLQATATVVDTRASFASLEAARGAVQSVVAPRTTAQRIEAMVAQVSVQRPQDRPAALVVTIDYSRN
ncbi:MAG TPA: hypothetical protein VN908_07480 [Gemmatimonadales bacterium]|nr:hypothetical protein [Gemmatimonadales bacterium]